MFERKKNTTKYNDFHNSFERFNENLNFLNGKENEQFDGLIFCHSEEPLAGGEVISCTQKK